MEGGRMCAVCCICAGWINRVSELLRAVDGVVEDVAEGGFAWYLRIMCMMFNVAGISFHIMCIYAEIQRWASRIRANEIESVEGIQELERTAPPHRSC